MWRKKRLSTLIPSLTLLTFHNSQLMCTCPPILHHSVNKVSWQMIGGMVNTVQTSRFHRLSLIFSPCPEGRFVFSPLSLSAPVIYGKTNEEATRENRELWKRRKWELPAVTLQYLKIQQHAWQTIPDKHLILLFGSRNDDTNDISLRITLYKLS